MCGIIFAKSLNGKKVNRLVVEQFQDQISRGTEGFGVIRQEINEKTGLPELVVDRATEETKFLFDLHPGINGSEMILAHHRTPTSTENATHQTHPIYVTHDLLKYDYYIAHNGVIYNDKERQKFHMEFFRNLTDKYLIETVLEWKDEAARINELLRFKLVPDEWFDTDGNIMMDKVDETKLWDCETLGYYYQTMMTDGKFNDSEALAVDLALYGEELIEKIEATGNAAFMGFKMEKGTNRPLSFFFGRNAGNPLNFARNQFTIQVSSEGIGNLIAANTITKIDLTDPKLKQHTYKLEIPTWSQPVTHYSSRNVYDNDAAEERELALAGETKSEVGFKADRDKRGQDNHAQADKHFESADEPISEISEGNGDDSENTFEKDPAFAEILGKAELDIEDRLSAFIEELSVSNDLEQVRTKVEEMAEAMTEWVDKVQMHKDQWIEEIVPSTKVEPHASGPKE